MTGKYLNPLLKDFQIVLYEHALKMISESIVREIDEEIKKHEFKFERFIPSTPDHDYNHSPATLHTLPMNGLSL